MKILDEHCAAAGRNPRDITRTALKTLVIGPDADAAVKKAEPLRESFGERFNVIGLAGGPDEARAQVRELREAGLDGLIVNLPDAYDLDMVALAGDALSGI
jgi:alkanesulfonate monooxygenase SsuD/methylene tetrahydromethanopterin reductase-like flavin-dependent oxidoreductase (luciferase family)